MSCTDGRPAAAPGPDELELVGAAVSALRRAPGPQLVRTAAAVRTGTDRVVPGLAVGGTCAEQVALGAALALGEDVVALAGVRHVDADTTRVTTPCARCRGLLRTHAPAVRVVHLADGLRVTGLAGLPPA